MIYKVLIVYVLISFTLCDHTNSSYLRNPHDTLTRVPTNRTHWDNSWNVLFSRVPQNTTTAKDKVELKVFYETLCPASIRFLTKRLRPVVEKLASHLDLHLIPYGHAKTYKVHGHYRFRCQHGPAECYGNKLHACVIDALQNNTQAALFNACLMQYSDYRSNSRTDYVSVLNWCNYKLNVHIHGVWDCVKSERGSVLLKKYGDETHALRPNYVPYLTLDGVTNKKAGGALMSTVCQMLQPSPAACYKYT